MRNDSAVEVRSLFKSYDKSRNVIYDFNMRIKKGEMVAITGRSGSGKSTLLNMIGLIARPTSGKVFICGEEVKDINSRQAMLLRRNTIGYLFQNYGLVDEESVCWNLNLAFAYKRINKKEKMKKINLVLDAFEMKESCDRKIHQLSGGEQQRVAIMRLLLQESKIILADEPTGSLDAANRNKVLNYLRQMNKNGKTVIIVTHDPCVAKACDREVSFS